MKVHPTQKKRNLTVSDQNGALSPATDPTPKKLKRLPHVFAKVLELPFNSNADVFVQETQDSFLFIVDSGRSTGDNDLITIGDDFRAHVIKILPGVTKIAVLRVANGGGEDSSVEELDIDAWRFRLPSTTRPEMASAKCIDGQLVVTVPKVVNVEDMARDDYEDDGIIGNQEEDVGKEEQSLFVVECM